MSIRALFTHRVVVAGLATLATLGIAAALGLADLRSGSVQATVPGAAGAAAIEFVSEDLYSVKRDTIERALPLTGTLVALTAASVKAKVAGELIEVPVREGQSVAKGQVLARIDQTEVLARVAARTADVEVARAQLSLAEKNRSTQRTLLDKNFISQNAFDTTQSGHDVALARLRAAQADLVSANKSLGDSVLVAPFSGIVSERHAQPGERVPLDAKVITIVDLSRLELGASIPAASISQVRIGQQVDFRVDGFGERSFQGRIERINPSAAAGSRSISVYAVIDNPGGLLRGGLFAQGELILERRDDALIVPASALREEIGQIFAYAVDAGQLRKKPVKLGQSDAAGRVEVLSGLDSGDRIVKHNLGPLREGAPVQIRERPPAASVR